jgi:alpha-beta hydrolase superfamily lysophospholipase
MRRDLITIDAGTERPEEIATSWPQDATIGESPTARVSWSTEEALGDHRQTATPLWFGPTDRRLFGWMHLPGDNLASSAVVLCPPLARELTSTHYTYRLLAESLANAGMAVVRFDYDGTGDSCGGDSDPHRVESWITSIGHAIDLARRSGVESVSLVGMRVGALLAAVAAARFGSIDAVVLWDPCSSARSFVREQAALQRMRGDVHPDGGDSTELPGFVFSAETMADLASLAMPDPVAPPSRALLLTRPGRPAASGFASSLGVVPEQAESPGQDLLLEVEPLLNEIPRDTIDHIVSWLDAGGSGPTHEVSPPMRDVAIVTFDGTPLTERIVRLGPAGLFGIATEPPTPTDSPTVLMLNSGNDWHVGPHRLWVDLSRRWAAAGFRCVRFDESGLGDSPTRTGCLDHVVRAPEAFEDVADAVVALEPDDPSNVILVGLCSGGYQALENALVRPPRGVYAINPILHFLPPELATGSLDPRRRICRPATGLVQAYRWLPIDPIRRRLGKLAWHVVHLFNHGRDPSNWLAQLARDNVVVLAVCGEEEARPFGAVAEAAARGSAEFDGIRIDVIDGLDHALLPACQRVEVLARMTDHLLGHFGSEQAQSIGVSASI